LFELVNGAPFCAATFQRVPSQPAKVSGFRVAALGSAIDIFSRLVALSVGYIGGGVDLVALNV